MQTAWARECAVKLTFKLKKKIRVYLLISTVQILLPWLI